MPGVNASRSAEKPAGLPGADPPRGSCIVVDAATLLAVLAARGRGHPFVAGRILRTAAGRQCQLSADVPACYHAALSVVSCPWSVARVSDWEWVRAHLPATDH